MTRNTISYLAIQLTFFSLTTRNRRTNLKNSKWKNKICTIRLLNHSRASLIDWNSLSAITAAKNNNNGYQSTLLSCFINMITVKSCTHLFVCLMQHVFIIEKTKIQQLNNVMQSFVNVLWSMTLVNQLSIFIFNYYE